MTRARDLADGADKDITGTLTVDGLDVDNINVDGNTISSTDTNGDITLDPNGTGDTIIASGNLGIGNTTVNSSLQVSKTQTALSGTTNEYGVHIYPTSSGATFVDGITTGSGGAGVTVRNYNNGTYNNIISGSTDTNSTTFQTGGTTRMTVTTGGLNIGGSGAQAKLEVNSAVSTFGSLTDSAINLATTAVGNRRANIGFGLAGGVANTNAATIGFEATSGSGALQGDLFFATRPSTSDSVPTERMRIASDGIAKFSSANNIGRIMTRQTVTIDDDSSVTLTNATSGAVAAMIYETNSGNGALVFFSYSGTPTIVTQPGITSFATSDTDGKFCIIGSAGAHLRTFKNRAGSSKTFNIFLIGGDCRP